MEQTDRSAAQQTKSRKDIWPLIILIILILIAASVFGCVAYYAGDNKYHWMEGVGMALMVIFMPLTAITFLHFRLPKKQKEFECIKKTLSTQDSESENYSFVFGQEHLGSDYFFPILFVCIFCVLGFYILFSNSAIVLFDGAGWVQRENTVYEYLEFRRNVVAVGMAFLGAYLWSIQYLFRRMMTLDLPPGAYYSIGTRMIYSSFIAVILQYFLNSTGVLADTKLNTQFIAISFMIGIFPERALAFMYDSLGRIFNKTKNSANSLDLEMIEGISSYHKARLSELGIDNVQNLAHSSLLELILKTPFRPRVIVDWMAQARLCLEFKDQTNAIRAAGIRTILDLQDIDRAEDASLLEKVSINAGVDITLVQTVCLANSNEASIDRLRKAYDALNLV